MAKQKCRYCGQSFQSRKALRDHQRAKHPDKLGLTYKKRVSRKRLAIYLVVILLAVGGVYGIYGLFISQGLLGLGPPGSTHVHAELKIYVDGRSSIDFSQGKYQQRSDYVHFEGGSGDVIHKHATGVTLGFFLGTLNIEFSSTCLVLDTGESYCNGGDKTLKLYVNRERNTLFDEYEIVGADEILISYGSETEEEIQAQLDSVAG
ncbi:MAG: hypothetical protein ACE5KH_04615 [Candidatus Geothermarchaeales archaeon]